MSSRTWVTVVPVIVAVSRSATAAELSPRRRASSWSTRMRSSRAGSIQSKLMSRASPVRCHDLGEPQGDLAHLPGVRAAHPVLQRPADRRPEFERRNTADHVRELLVEHLAEPLLQPLARGDVLRDQHDLAEERIGQLHVQRQVEADGAAPDVAAPALDVRILGEDRVEPLDGCFGGEDRGVLRQPQIDQQLDAVGRREELPRHQVQRQQRDGEGPSAAAMVIQGAASAPARKRR